MENNTNDLGIMRRLIAECWLSLCMTFAHSINEQVAKDVLIEATEHALEIYPKDSCLNWQVGYMMSLFPNLFIKSDISDDKYMEFEKRGVEMLRFAYMSNPDNLVFKKSYLSSFISSANDEEYKKVCTSIKEYMRDIFNGDTDIERYFKAVLSNGLIH